MSQPDFLYELFEDFMDDPVNQDFSMDNGLVCRWMTGQAKISPKISAYYSKPSNQEKLAHTIHQNLLPLMSDCNMAIPQIANYTMFLTEQQEPERGISELQKLSGIIKECHSDDCLDYAKVQETLATIYLMTANLSQAKTYFKKAFKIYEKIWADEPEMIEAKYREIQELYPQIGFFIGKTLSSLLTKQT